MKLLTFFTAFVLVGLLTAAPTSDDDDKVVVTKEFYIDEFIKYKADHDIVSIVVPLNSLNFDENESSSSESNEIDTDVIIFFVEGDYQEDGNVVYQGLYVLKQGKATKILDNGKAAASSGDDSKKVFFGASDGLYVYNQKTNTAEKYGSIQYSIIGIQVEKASETIYILTEDNKVYKVTDNGEKKELLDAVVDAKQIILDFEDNLYFYGDDNKLFVLTSEGAKEIKGLPNSSGPVTLFKPPFFLDNGATFVVEDKVYVAYPNATSELTDFSFSSDALPTAFGAEAALVQYYAYDKKIYEYNILALILGTLLEELGDYLKKSSNEIRTFASKENSLQRKLQATH